MNLLADIGNSHLKWALQTPEGLAGHRSVPYEADGLTATLDEHWAALPAPRRVLASNVGGPRIAGPLSNWVAAHWGIEAELPVSPAAGHGVTSAYREPHTLGVDRWLTLIAVHGRSERPACIIDCGTAITLDALAADGRHLGGLIVPGIALMRRSLTERAPGVFIREGAPGEVALLAASTTDAVRAGTLYAAVAVVDRVVGDVASALGEEVDCVITGGDAAQVAELLAHDCERIPDLVLRGLALWAGAASDAGQEGAP